jgi:hypothetical protein
MLQPVRNPFIRGPRPRPCRRAGRLAHRLLLALAAVMAVGQAAAQDVYMQPATGEQRVNDYLVRWNTTIIDLLPEAAVETHDLPSKGHGVLNVVVLRRADKGPPTETVAAEVSASVRNLRGQVQPLDIRPVEANGQVSYLGTFAVAERDQLRFEVAIQIPGERPLALTFERRFLLD